MSSLNLVTRKQPGTPKLWDLLEYSWPELSKNGNFTLQKEKIKVGDAIYTKDTKNTKLNA